MHGESASADEEAAVKYRLKFQEFIETEGYRPQQIFSCDETEEFQEILNEEHQETQRNVSPFEQEEDKRGAMRTSAIKDLLKKWEYVRAKLS
ncbi:hypothetical protein TNCV_1724171 [Trichonephila clavipes]|nr:hypothetical protein TNCV_1724171 [Trichonephila clavipes]